MIPPLSPLAELREVRARLQAIFPPGTPNRNVCTWDIAARTVFVMLYIGAVEGRPVWLRPDQVTRMTDSQASMTGYLDRGFWGKTSIAPAKREVAGRWYAGNTRESVRDDTLRTGLIGNGAVVERQGLPTTSPAGRYALTAAFAGLFAPTLTGEALSAAVAEWRERNLNAGALARIAILRKGAVASGEGELVTFPNGETRRLAPGPSTVIAKAVVEIFAVRFLSKPGVVFVSESGNKIVARDDALARAIGLDIRADKNLPDIVLVDLGPGHPLLVFVEVVATDGPIDPRRKEALSLLATDAGFALEHVAFVTAFLDRGAPAYRKTLGALAWGSFVWFAAEPDKLVVLHDGGGARFGTLADWRR